MADYRQFAGPNGTVLVEVETIPGASAHTGDLKDLLAPIADVARILASQQPEQGVGNASPDIEVTFGIKGLSDGRVAVSLDGKGSFLVRIKWSSQGGGSGLSLPPEMPGT